MRVIGTAGHVDHGKTTLVSALTGINPDRLKEEQERAMTIDLGFAWLTLPSGQEIGIVDVPGHRDFIENMLAGVGGIDAALLVIAADEGVMPQTREHLAILDLLQIRSGLIVLTKTDLVEDSAWLDLVEADIRTLVRDTVFQDAQLIRVSSRTRAGFPDLLRLLDGLLQSNGSVGDPLTRPDLGRPRLPIDRVFSIAGFGTVVTGTLSDGSLATGEEVEILPSGRHARIRGLQTHKKKEELAVPGTRTAVNLSGVDVDQLHRGEVIVHPDQYHPTRRLDVRIRLLLDISSSLHHGTEVKFFINTSESIARVRLLGTEVLKPGESGWLQLELRTPVVAVRGDRYILRRPSPGETLGGGTVVDPQPDHRHKRFDKAVLGGLESMARGSPSDVLLQTSLALGPATEKAIISHSRLDVGAAVIALQELLAAGQMIDLDTLLMAASQWMGLRTSILAALDAFHGNNPLRRGMPREELKSRLKLQPRLFAAVLKKLSSEAAVVENGTLVSLPGHAIQYSPEQQKAIQDLMLQFAAAPFGPPSIKESQGLVGEDVFTALVDAGDLVVVSPEVVFRRQDYEIMVEKIRQAIRQKGQITLAEVRDLLKTSRRYVQALLEHLDAVGVTIRAGDVRRLGK